MKTRFRSQLTMPNPNQPGKRGFVLNPGASLELDFCIVERAFPTRQSLHFVAEHDLLGKLMVSDGYLLKHTYHRIDDAVESDPALGAPETHVLHLSGAGEEWPREAYIPVNPKSLPKEQPLTFCVSALARDLQVDRDGELGVELGIYRARPGRHAEDVSQPPDEVTCLRLPEGTHPWQLLSRTVRLPADTVMLLVRVGGKRFSGDAWIGSPRLFATDCETVIPPLTPHLPIAWKAHWTGINLSHKEWPRFSLALDNRVFFHRRVYFPGDHWHDFDVPIPMLAPGQHQLTVKLDRDYPDRLPIKVLSVELLEESARKLEIVWHPEYAPENTSFPVLIEQNTSERSELIVHQVDAGMARSNPRYELPVDGELTPITLRRIVRSVEQPLHLGVGDIYCLPQTSEEFQRYLVWYLENQQGNGIHFRSMYYSNGTRVYHPEAWRTLVRLVNQLQLTYHYIEDGRNLNDLGINPPDALLQGPCYHGRQQHELDLYLYDCRIVVNNPLEHDLRQRFQVNFRYALPIVARVNGKAFIQNMTGVDDVRKAERCWLQTLRSFRGARGVSRHTGSSMLFRYFLKAGYDWIGAQQMYGPEEVTLAAARGASRAYGKTAFGAHLAHQWGSVPHDTPDHAHRFFLSLATSYLQGATEIDTEDGQWRITYGFDRFSDVCRTHQQVQRDFLSFVQTHPRRGVMRVPIAVMQGRHCGWMGCSRNKVWASERPEFAFGLAEESFDLLQAYYPRTVLDALYEDFTDPTQYRANERYAGTIIPPHEGATPRRSNGWYSGTPYGPVDLLPVEAPLSVLRKYDAMAFLGWNTFQEGDFRRLLRLVTAGGTLLLARPHLSTTLRRGAAFNYPDSPILDELLGNDWQHTTERVERTVGQGRVIFYGQACYPADRPIRTAYERDLRRLGEDALSHERARGWIRGTDDVNFAVYDWADGRLRTIYLLTIDWWREKTEASATLLFGRGETPLVIRKGRIEVVTLSRNLAVHVDTPDADILDIREEGNRAVITMQSDQGAVLNIYRRSALQDPTMIHISHGGVQEIVLPV